jgi:hypothetical protein
MYTHKMLREKEEWKAVISMALTVDVTRSWISASLMTELKAFAFPTVTGLLHWNPGGSAMEVRRICIKVQDSLHF